MSEKSLNNFNKESGFEGQKKTTENFATQDYEIVLAENSMGEINRGEILKLKKQNEKMFRTKEGYIKEVDYSQKNFMEGLGLKINELTESQDEKFFINEKHAFNTRFNKKEISNELFRVEKDGCEMIVSICGEDISQVPSKIKQGKKDTVVFNEISSNIDLEYVLLDDRVKENIIVKEKRDFYNLSYHIQLKNLIPKYESSQKSITFYSKDTLEEMFYIPPPFMVDALGERSLLVEYNVENISDDFLEITILPDKTWMNDKSRVFPITIDPQVVRAYQSQINTYSGTANNQIVSTVHELTTTSSVTDKLFIELSKIYLPDNVRIKKAELIIAQSEIDEFEDLNYPLLKLYKTNSNGVYYNDYQLFEKDFVDCQPTKSQGVYKFNITPVIREFSKSYDYYRYLAIKIVPVDGADGSVKLYGSSGNIAPKLKIVYDDEYKIESEGVFSSHSLGRLGMGKIDLIRGNLLIETEDFIGEGHKMPLTIKHYYDSSKASCNYGDLGCVNNLTSKFGYGWKLNLIQSVQSQPFVIDDQMVQGYIYRNEKGEYITLQESKDKAHLKSRYDGCEYYLYVDTEELGYTFDPYENKLERDDLVYKFDFYGRLTSITNKYGVSQIFGYYGGLLSYAVDGAGRNYYFEYNSKNYLTCIRNPEQKTIRYEYSNYGALERIHFEDCTAEMDWYYICHGYMPIKLSVNAINGFENYGVEYEYLDDRVIGTKEYLYTPCDEKISTGRDVRVSYDEEYNNTTVTSTGNKVTSINKTALTTTYCYDDENKLLSCFVKTPDSKKYPTVTSDGLHPYLDNNYKLLSTSSNLLINHTFTDCNYAWQATEGDRIGLEYDVVYGSPENSPYGHRFMYVKDDNSETVNCGIYQTVNSLPAGTYTFSSYIKILGTYLGNDENVPGAYLKVWDSEGITLNQSAVLMTTTEEYMRLSVTFSIDSTKDIMVGFLHNGSGTMYINAPQLEMGNEPTAYNLIENGNCELDGYGWSTTDGATTTTDNSFDGKYSIKISGDIFAKNNAYQRVYVKSRADVVETFTLSGWAKGSSLLDSENGIPTTFRLRAEITYTADENETPEKETYVCNFSASTLNWQYISGVFYKSKLKEIDYITVFCDFDFNIGTAYFDCIQLTTNEVIYGASQATIEEKKEKDSESEIENKNEESKEIKDQFGNDLTETVFAEDELGTIYGENLYNELCCVSYNEAGNDLIKKIDSLGNTIDFEVDGLSSKIKSLADALGNKLKLTYDNRGRPVTMSYVDRHNKEQYRLTASFDERGNIVNVSRGDGLKYTFKYDGFNNLTEFTVNGVSTPIIKYYFNDNNGKISKFIYGNGQCKELEYDVFGRIIGSKWYKADGNLFESNTYEYGNSNNKSRIIDAINNSEEVYIYDKGNLVAKTSQKYEIANSSKTVSKDSYSVFREYDSLDKCICESVIIPDGKAYKCEFDNTDDNLRNWKLSFGDSEIKFKSHTDKLNRPISEQLQTQVGALYRKFDYVEGKIPEIYKERKKVVSAPTTNLTKSMTFNNGRKIEYDYDKLNRIVSSNDSLQGVTEYVYDDVGRLIKEIKNGQTVTEMSYDNYGNILSKNGKVYEYDTVWKDKLISYDGRFISYDYCGNPLEFLGANLEWNCGKKLTSYTKGGHAYKYTYDSNGVRISKEVDGVKHNYLVDNYKIISETWEDNVLVPLYNGEDVIGIIYNDNIYYFLKNQFNDILEMLDAEGNTVAEYSYDVWGKCTLKCDSSNIDIATANPFRYRSYYYDEETDLYYLQTRYYSPEIGRFLNMDSINILKNYSFVYEYNNAFAYAANCPVMRTDKYGQCSIWDNPSLNDVDYMKEGNPNYPENSGMPPTEGEGVIHEGNSKGLTLVATILLLLFPFLYESIVE